MALTLAQRNRQIRKEALREQLSVQCHYQHFSDAMEKMTELAGGSIDQDAKDRFSMFNAIADKHLKVVLRYLPPEATEEAQKYQDQIQAIRRVIVHPIRSHEGALAQLDQLDAQIPEEGSQVPA
jgi:hypothetical protein